MFAFTAAAASAAIQMHFVFLLICTAFPFLYTAAFLDTANFSNEDCANPGYFICCCCFCCLAVHAERQILTELFSSTLVVLEIEASGEMNVWHNKMWEQQDCTALTVTPLKQQIFAIFRINRSVRAKKDSNDDLFITTGLSLLSPEAAAALAVALHFFFCSFCELAHR